MDILSRKAVSTITELITEQLEQDLKYTVDREINKMINKIHNEAELQALAITKSVILKVFSIDKTSDLEFSIKINRDEVTSKGGSK